MSNFAFARTALPSVHPDAARAESYLTSDARTAVVYSRRTVKQIVGHLYDVLSLSVPYQDDLAARIGDAAFLRSGPRSRPSSP